MRTLQHDIRRHARIKGFFPAQCTQTPAITRHQTRETVFRSGSTQIVAPLAGAGIISGVIITFVPALGAYLTPDLMGGPDSQMIANVIERQFKRANDWPFGAALSFLLMYATFMLIALQALRTRKAEARR